MSINLPKEKKRCECCGKIYMPHSGHQKYCSIECRNKATIQNQRNNRDVEECRRRASKNAKEVNKRRKVLVNINNEARKEGLTYGQYVARHGLT